MIVLAAFVGSFLGGFLGVYLAKPASRTPELAAMAEDLIELKLKVEAASLVYGRQGP